VRARMRVTSATLVLVTAGVTATGYVRELVLASLFGAGAEMDAFYFSLALVLAVHDLVFAGALGASIVPLLHARNVEVASSVVERARIVVTSTLLVLVVAGGLAIAMWAAMGPLIDLMAPRMSAQVRAETTAIATVLIWTLPAGALITLFTLVLNAHHRFALAAAVYLGNNLVFIVALAALAPALGARALPLAALAGPVLTLPPLIVALARLGLLRPVRPDLSRAFFQHFWRLARPLLLSLGIGSIGGLLMTSHLIIRAFAADFGEGAIAALGYAFRLYEVPLSLLANPAATLILPVVASFYAAGRFDEIGHTCRQLFLWGLIVLFPAAMVLWGGAELIVHALLQRGHFGAEAAQATAQALRAFAPALLMEATFVVFFRVFYALRLPNRTVMVSFVALASLVAFLTVVPKGIFFAVPLSLSAAFTVAAAVLVGLLVRHLGRQALPAWGQLGRWSIAAVLALAAWWATPWNGAQDVGAEFAALTVFICAYVVAIAILLPECRQLVSGTVQEAAARAGWRR
jgi:putative peptidoglycan lipid II flippase